MSKINVIVLMGGQGAEREVSLASGKQVAVNLDQKKYRIFPVEITPGGQYLYLNKSQLNQLEARINNKPPSNKLILKSTTNLVKPASGQTVVFIAMHGLVGEDGRIQGMLDILNLPYTGSGVLASAIGMNKLVFKQLLQSANISTPSYEVHSTLNQTCCLKYPVIVKPLNQGSSIGVTVVFQKTQIRQAKKIAFNYSPQILIEKYLRGTEITCGILGNEQPIALPVVEIVTKKPFFDYEAKYQPDLTDEIVPARLPKSIVCQAQEMAKKVYRLIGAQGFGRIDMIIYRKTPYILEINTIPGLTPFSLLPKAAAAAGISYSQLLDQIIKLSLAK